MAELDDSDAARIVADLSDAASLRRLQELLDRRFREIGDSFTPFPEPVKGPDRNGESGDLPLVTPAGTKYRCSGCGGLVPPGVWITETIEDGMITGLSMRMGADGPVVHTCGSVA